MYICLTRKKARHPLFCILRSAGTAGVVLMTARVLGPLNSIGHYLRGDTGRIKPPEKSVKYNCLSWIIPICLRREHREQLLMAGMLDGFGTLCKNSPGSIKCGILDLI
jgi:hypothetical protein